MSTPFEDVTWRLRNTWNNQPFTGPSQAAHPDVFVQSAYQVTNTEHYPVAQSEPILGHTFSGNEYQPPLRDRTSFVINIGECESVEVTFLDLAPQNTKAIWADACNVYYDRFFLAIRGDLMYDKKTGLASSAFGSHFIISYDGRMATGGASRQLSIELYGEQDISTPTFELLHRQFESTCVMYAKRGSWKAD